MAKKEERSFEESISRLEEIVKGLEKGEASLEESLTLFQEGTALAAVCHKQLEKAEQKITLVTGEKTQEDFNIE